MKMCFGCEENVKKPGISSPTAERSREVLLVGDNIPDYPIFTQIYYNFCTNSLVSFAQS